MHPSEPSLPSTTPSLPSSTPLLPLSGRGRASPDPSPSHPAHTLSHPLTPSHTLSHPLTPSYALLHPLTPSYTPLLHRLPEFKFWYSLTKAFVVAFTLTFFAVFNIPVSSE